MVTLASIAGPFSKNNGARASLELRHRLAPPQHHPACNTPLKLHPMHCQKQGRSRSRSLGTARERSHCSRL